MGKITMAKFIKKRVEILDQLGPYGHLLSANFNIQLNAATQEKLRQRMVEPLFDVFELGISKDLLTFN